MEILYTGVNRKFNISNCIMNNIQIGPTIGPTYITINEYTFKRINVS